MTVMLAEPTPKGTEPTDLLARLTEAGEWLFDTKWDGVRCLARLGGKSTATLTNRNGVDITYRYPDVVASLLATDMTDVTLDGEIVAFNPDGVPDFNLVAKRDRQTTVDGAKRAARTVPVAYIVFDLLDWGGDLRETPLAGRLAMLDHVLVTNRIVSRSIISTDALLLWEQVDKFGLEGVIAKQTASVYLPGRQPSWIKIKRQCHISAIVTGWEEGKGHRANRVGALTLGLYDPDGSVVEVGKVGTGFTDDDLEQAATLIEQKVSQFGSDLVVDVTYGNLTTDGRLRFPSFRGFRSDVNPTDCTTEQLRKLT